DESENSFRWMNASPSISPSARLKALKLGQSARPASSAEYESWRGSKAYTRASGRILRISSANSPVLAPMSRTVWIDLRRSHRYQSSPDGSKRLSSLMPEIEDHKPLAGERT